MNIGFSTGILYKTDLSVLEQIDLCSRSGANSIEVTLLGNDWDALLALDNLGTLLSPFEFVTLHGPEVGEEPEKTIEKIREVLLRIPSAKFVALHPDKIDNFGLFAESGIPFAVENMNRKKKSAHRADFFEKLSMEYVFPFVLDVQHAYEQDPTMQVAEELIETMGEHLAYFHVSGEQEGKSHTLLHQSRNKEEITSFLRKHGAKAPIILEGVSYGEDHLEEMKKEINFITQSIRVTDSPKVNNF